MYIHMHMYTLPPPLPLTLPLPYPYPYPNPYVRFRITKPLNAVGTNLRNLGSLAAATQTVWVQRGGDPRLCPAAPTTIVHTQRGRVQYSTKYTNNPDVLCHRPAPQYLLDVPRTDPLSQLTCT